MVSIPNQTTYSTKLSHIEKRWYLIDASGVPVGRLASFIANILVGKHKAYYAPHLNCGDAVVVTNAEDVLLTGRKMERKMYHRYSGYPGGLKSFSASHLIRKGDSSRILRSAVKGMLRRGALGNDQIRNMYLYDGVDHKHQAQKPKVIDSKVICEGKLYGSWQ